MGIKLFILVAGSAGVFGIACGYFLRWLVSLGKKGSVELRIKEMELTAEVSAKRITDEAEKRAARALEDLKRAELEKEVVWNGGGGGGGGGGRGRAAKPRPPPFPRPGTSFPSEVLTTTVTIPSDEVK